MEDIESLSSLSTLIAVGVDIGVDVGVGVGAGVDLNVDVDVVVDVDVGVPELIGNRVGLLVIGVNVGNVEGKCLGDIVVERVDGIVIELFDGIVVAEVVAEFMISFVITNLYIIKSKLFSGGIASPPYVIYKSMYCCVGIFW